MGLALGSTPIDDVKLGSSQVDAVYAGAEKVWPTLWQPSDHTPLHLWLDASDSSTITVTGQGVSNWSDKSGNNRNASQGTDGFRPITGAASQNGLNVLQFNGSDEFFTFGTALNNIGLVAPLGCSVFMMVKIDTDPPPTDAQSGLWKIDSGSDNTHYRFLDGNIYDGFGSNVRKVPGNVATNLAQWNILEVFNDTANGYNFWLNGTAVFGTASNTYGISGTSFLGRSGAAGGFFLDGNIAEMILCEGASISVADRQLFEGYLAWKWGRQSVLPGGHPYKNEPPGSP